MVEPRASTPVARCMAASVILALLTACGTTNVIPPSLQERIDVSLTFKEIRENPSAYGGRLVLVGGAILSGKWLKDGTRLEILQLPLDGSHEPGFRLTESQGRFLAFQKEFLDPATMPPGTRVTIVGEITGTVTLPIDERDYVYPLIEIKALTVWSRRLPGYLLGPYPYFGAYWGSYWGPYSGAYGPLGPPR